MNTTSLIVIGTITIGILWFIYSAYSDAERRKTLTAKYADSRIVDLIMRGSLWQGQTQVMLLDSLGNPESVETKVLKSKQREIWKYGHLGASRYRTRITLEDGIVAGWENKPDAQPSKPRASSPISFDEPKRRRKKSDAWDD